jgi:hypothetical protein
MRQAPESARLGPAGDTCRDTMCPTILGYPLTSISVRCRLFTLLRGETTNPPRNMHGRRRVTCRSKQQQCQGLIAWPERLFFATISTFGK